MPTVTDIFAGAGGSSTGMIAVRGVTIATAANHLQLAVDVHNANHPDTEHMCVDLHLEDPRNFPRTDFLWASPECTKWSIANNKAKALSAEMGGDPTLFDDVPEDLETTDHDEATRSRLLMFDVLRFVEHHRYRVVFVENVVDIATQAKYRTAWTAWQRGLRKLGYTYRVVSLNSMHAQAGGHPAVRPRPHARRRRLPRGGGMRSQAVVGGDANAADSAAKATAHKLTTSITPEVRSSAPFFSRPSASIASRNGAADVTKPAPVMMYVAFAQRLWDFDREDTVAVRRRYCPSTTAWDSPITGAAVPTVTQYASLKSAMSPIVGAA